MRALTTLLALAVAVPAFAQTKQVRAGIVNFTQVDAVVACGGATETSALDGLRKDGFRTVINLRMPTEQGANIEQNTAYAKEIGLNYISLPFNGAAPEAKAVDTFLGAIANKANQPVFVHCGSASRVGGMWFIKRVLQDGWEMDKAMEEAKLIGLNNPVLEKFAVEYINSHKK
jgi:uncharacterized protein (TIGR01244 family)